MMLVAVQIDLVNDVYEKDYDEDDDDDGNGERTNVQEGVDTHIGLSCTSRFH